MSKIGMLSLIITVFAVLQFCNESFAAGQTKNPIAAFYSGPEGYPLWTDNIKWENVITMSSKGNGTENFTEFERVRDQLHAQGGGVLYYPGGVYEFNVPGGPNGRGLLLKDGVVLLGANPLTDSNAIVDYDSPGLSQLKTVFRFTSKENGFQSVMNFIGTTPADAKKVGVAWVVLENAYVYFGFNATKWAPTWSTADCWLAGLQISAWDNRKPDGTLVFDPFVGDGYVGKWNSGDALYGSMRFVFGCRLDNAFIQNYVVNSGKCTEFTDDQESYRFGGVLSVYGSHVFVANNVVTKITIPVIRNDRLCIDVNKQLLAMYENRCDVKNRVGYYAEDVIVVGNWVHNKGNKSYEVSGTWATVRSNVAHKEFVNTAYKFRTCQGGQAGVADYMNRGFDFGGYNFWAHDNEVRETGSMGNDGEGILVQRHNEIELFSHAYTLNRAFAHAGQAADKGYISPYDVHAAGLIQFNNATSGNVGLRKVTVRDKNGVVTSENFTGDITVVKNEAANGASLTDVKDLVSTCPSGVPVKPSTIKIEDLNFGKKISWVDKSNNEIGFRIDRRIGSKAPYTIAYRPRNSQGSNTLNYNPSGKGGGGPCDCAVAAGYDFNPQEWVDFTMPNTKETVEYRVVAITCDDNDVGASEWFATNGSVVDLNKHQGVGKGISSIVFVNNTVVDLQGISLASATIKLLDCKGRTVVKNDKISTANNRILFGNISVGAYFFLVQSEGKSITKKLVIY